MSKARKPVRAFIEIVSFFLFLAAPDSRAQAQTTLTPNGAAAQETAQFASVLTTGTIPTAGFLGAPTLGAAAFNISFQPSVIWSPRVGWVDSRVIPVPPGEAELRPLTESESSFIWRTNLKNKGTTVSEIGAGAVYRRSNSPVWGSMPMGQVGHAVTVPESSQIPEGGMSLGISTSFATSSCLDSPAGCASFSVTPLSPLPGIRRPPSRVQAVARPSRIATPVDLVSAKAKSATRSRAKASTVHP